jgi:hypothetical protein
MSQATEAFIDRLIGAVPQLPGLTMLRRATAAPCSHHPAGPSGPIWGGPTEHGSAAGWGLPACGEYDGVLKARDAR